MVLGCGCEDNTVDPTIERAVGTKALNEITESDDDFEVLNTNYKNVTPLFRNIEKENWEGVLLFLTCGKWSKSLLSSSNEHMRSPSPEIQARTWVTSYDRRGQPEWSQLPLHAAISYLAPPVVIQKLLELYEKGIRCTDNEGMLPIHLAFGFGAPDSVLAMLMTRFPASANERGLGGRLPHECCELGPNKFRGQVFKIVTDEAKTSVHKDIATEWKGFAASASKSLQIEEPLNLEEKKLTEFILELMHDKKELAMMKEKDKARKAQAAAATASAMVPPVKGKKVKKGKSKRSG